MYIIILKVKNAKKTYFLGCDTLGWNLKIGQFIHGMDPKNLH